MFQRNMYVAFSLMNIYFFPQVFCGKIPRDLYEDELIPLFEKCGKIWDLRLMMDPMTSLNRGYAFVTFTKREFAQEAVRQVINNDDDDCCRWRRRRVCITRKCVMLEGNKKKSISRETTCSPDKNHCLYTFFRSIFCESIFSFHDDRKCLCWS